MLYKPPFLIDLQNKINKVWNAIYNNRLSNHIKDTFYYLVGTPYPEFMYCDSSGMYVASVSRGYQTENKTLRTIRLLFGLEAMEVTVDLTSSSVYALDVSTLPFWKKKKLLKDVNKARLLSSPQVKEIFRFRKILTYS